MRVGPRVFALVVALWGLGLTLLGRGPGAAGCGLGACGPCTACLTPPAPAVEVAEGDRVG